MSTSSKPTVAVVGASRNRSKYGNISVRAHRQEGYEVFPINPHADEIEGIPAYPTLSDIPVEQVDRVTVYVPPEVGLLLLDDIAAIQPGEVWFNPGSGSREIVERANRLSLNVIQGCSIVDLGVSPAQFG